MRFYHWKEGGETIDAFLDDFQGVSRAQALAALFYGKAWLMPAGMPQPTGKAGSKAEISDQYRALQLYADETGRRGQVIYENHLQPALDTDENLGRFLAIDVNSGDYVVGDRMEASRILCERRPDAIIYLMKIGYPAATKMGGSMLPLPRRSTGS